MKWGYQPERLQAGVFIIIYTVCASLPILASFLWLFFKMGTHFFVLAKFVFLGQKHLEGLPILVRRAVWFFLVLGFMVKIPVFPFHS